MCDGMVLNRKGFTMPELLATIVIIGILSTIGIVIVVNVRENQREKFNETQNETFVETAKTYFNDNRSLLPQTPLSSEYVTLKELIDNNYLDDNFIDYDKQSYDPESKVIVRKIGNNEYGYSGTLVSEQGGEITTLKATITDTWSYKNEKGPLTLSAGETKIYSNTNPTIGFTMKSTNGIKIEAYNYVIYKNDVEFKKSEVLYVEKSDTFNDEITIKVDDFTDAEYKLKVSVYDL
jgi:prepilin-type N-terminal cleavage/methylation domain-containing protein